MPPARLFDEMQKLLLSGHAVETLSSLRAHGLSHGLLPLLDMILEQPLGTKFIEVALAGTDARVRDGKSVSPAFLFATLLWHEVLQQWNAAKSRGEKPLPALFDAMDRVLERAGGAHLDPAPASRRRSRRSGRCSRASSSARAPAPTACSSTSAFARPTISWSCARQSGEVPQALVDWWTRFQDAGEAERESMLKPDEAPKKGRRSRGRGRKRREDDDGAGGTSPSGEPPDAN